MAEPTLPTVDQLTRPPPIEGAEDKPVESGPLEGFEVPVGLDLPDFDAFKPVPITKAPLQKDVISASLQSDADISAALMLGNISPLDEDSIAENDFGRQQVRMVEDIQNTLVREDDLPPAQKLTQAKIVASRYKTYRTFGQIYVDNKFNDLDQNIKQPLSLLIDFSVRSQENQQFIAQNIDGDQRDYEVFLKDVREGFTELEKSFAETAANEDYFLEWPGFRTPEEAGKSIQNVEDFIKFVTLVPTDKDVTVDVMRVIDTLLEGKGLDSFDNQFFTEVEGRYGPDWKLRFTAAVLTEIGVDAALLIAAMLFPPSAGLVLAGRGASLATKFRAAIARAAVVGLGGGTVFTLANRAVGESANFPLEVSTRFAGALVGEAAVPVVKGVVKGTGSLYDILIGKTTQQLAKKYNLPVFSESMHKAIINNGRISNPLFKNSILAAVHQYSKEYMRLADMVVDGTLTPEMKSIRKHVSKLTGIADEDLEVFIGLGREIFQGDKFRHIGEAAEQFERLAAVTAARQRLAQVQAEALEADLLARAAINEPETPPAIRQQLAKEAEDLAGLARQAQDEATELARIADEGAQLQTTLGSAIDDAVITSEALGFRFIGEVQSRQSAVQDILFYNFSQSGKRFQPFEYALDERGLLSRGMDKLLQFGRVIEPDKLPIPEIAKNLLVTQRQSLRYMNAFEQSWNAALGKLGKKSKRRVMSVLMEGDEAEKLFTLDDLLGHPAKLTKDEIDSFYAIRQILDLAHKVEDSFLVRELNKRGIRQIEGKLVNVIPDPRLPKGMVRIQEIAVSGAPASTRLSAIVPRETIENAKVTNVLPAHPGYIPISYTNARYAVTKINTKTGGTERIGAFPTISQATKQWRKVSSAEKNPDVFYVYSSWNQFLGQGKAGLFKKDMKAINVLDESSLNAIKDDLAEQGLSEQQVKIVLDELDLGSLRRRITGARADERIGRRKPTEEAVLEYLQGVSGNRADWRVDSIQRFKEKFAAVLRPDKAWHDPDAIIKSRGEALAAFGNDPNALRAFDQLEPILQGIKQQQNYLFRNITGTTRHQTAVKNWLDNKIVAFAGSSNWSARQFASLLDVGGPDILNHVINHTRGAAAWSKLLFLVPAQTIVQGSQAMINVGVNPQYVMPAMKDAMIMFMGGTLRQLGHKGGMSKEAEHLLNIVSRSAYLRDLNTVDVARAADLSINGSKMSLSQIGLQAVQSPFRAGEAFNRIIAFNSARRRLIDEFGKGKLLGKDGLQFKGKIDDDDFIDLVVDRAKVVALNMSRTGELEAFSGVGSVVFQFKQVLPKTVSMFTSSALNPAQKVGAAAVMLGMWGQWGVPLLGDLIAGTDIMWEKITNQPTNVGRMRAWTELMAPVLAEYIGTDPEFTERFLNKGLVKAMSEGRIDIVHRVALGRFFYDSLQVQQNPLDAIPAFAVYNDLLDAWEKIGGGTAANLAYDFVNIPQYVEMFTIAVREARGEIPNGSYKEALRELWRAAAGDDENLLAQVLRGESTLGQFALRAMSEVGEAFSSVGAVAKYIDNTNPNILNPDFRVTDPTEPNFYRTSSGRLLDVLVKDAEIKQLLFSINPGPVVDAQDLDNIRRDIDNRLVEYRKEQVKRFLEPGVSNETQYRIMEETIQEISALASLMNSRNLDISLSQDWARSIFNMFEAAMLTRSLPDFSKITNE